MKKFYELQLFRFLSIIQSHQGGSLGLHDETVTDAVGVESTSCCRTTFRSDALLRDKKNLICHNLVHRSVANHFNYEYI